jgi:hypothetical protein
MRIVLEFICIFLFWMVLSTVGNFGLNTWQCWAIIGLIILRDIINDCFK